MSANRLSKTTSPYLLQHADNPVDWYPWDEEALQLARQQNKPILLSIGYSACHWCHVMAHESFEDEATATLMNELFINIKVDREERPDLDKIYQAAYQLMNRQGGGWPLTVFLTPDNLVPFFTGTYFPPVASYGRPAFKEVMISVDKAWRTREAEIREHNQAILDAFARPSSSSEKSDLHAQPISKAGEMLVKSFDPDRGGFSGAPKFPHPDMLQQCLFAWHDGDSQEQRDMALQMADVSALHMALGGIFDHLGGGFCRYSTDSEWKIPHFEKMLYDNGPLLGFYSDLLLITGNLAYARVIDATANWVQTEMQSRAGGYFSAQDADSEGEEGRFYIWNPDQVRQLLSDGEYALVSERFSLDQPPNFEGQWHLHCDAQRFPEALDAEQQLTWDGAREKLYQARALRVHPGTDDKILTSWNALMIKGMVKAAKVSGQQEWLASAERALNFIQQNLWKDGRLLAAHRENVSHLNAYLDDYAYLVDAIIELLTAKWNSAYLAFAIELADVLLDQFEDRQQGGFFFTANEHEALIHRPRPFADEAMPSGNGIAARALMRLGYLAGRMDYLEAAEKTLRSAWADINQYPHAHCSLLQALQEYLDPPEIIIIRGPAETLTVWLNTLQKKYSPHRQVFAIANDETGLPDALRDKKPLEKTCAYVCQGMTCLAPVTDIGELSVA